MAKLFDYFKNIVTTVLGGIPHQDKNVTKSIEEIDVRLNRTSYSNLFEMVANMHKERNKGANTDKAISLKDLTDVQDDYQDQIHDLFMRRAKYATFVDMMKKISRLKRTVKVLRSNIVSSDNLHNRTLVFDAVSDGDYEKEVTSMQETFKYLKITDYKNITKVIDSYLKYGDFMVEIAVAKDIIPSPNRAHLLESTNHKNTTSNMFEDVIETKEGDRPIGFNVSLCMNTLQQKLIESTGADDEIALKDLIIIYHKPHNVIKLYIGDMVYGYIIIPENVLRTKLIFQNIDVLSSQSKLQDFSNSMGIDYMFAQKALNRSIAITDNIIDYLKKQINEKAVGDNEALRSVISKLVCSSVFSIGLSDKHGNMMNNVETIKIGNLPLRFVDTSKMQEFCLNPDEYAPYGTSIFDDIIFDAKLLVSDKITSSIERITKSIERRIVNFESDDRNSTAMIQILKEKFRKKKALFDGSTSFDNIPGLISPFEEYYIPTKEGTPYLSFTTEAPTSQHSARVDDMKFKRDEIASDLGVPPAYIGLEENIESKATLFLQNIMFGVEVTDYQGSLSDDYTELGNKINRLIGAPANKVRIGFARPVILNSASELEHISVVSGVKDFLIEVGMEKSMIRERYMPFLNEYFTNAATTVSNISKLEHGKEGNEDDKDAGGF